MKEFLYFFRGLFTINGEVNISCWFFPTKISTQSVAVTGESLTAVVNEIPESSSLSTFDKNVN